MTIAILLVRSEGIRCRSRFAGVAVASQRKSESPFRTYYLPSWTNKRGVQSRARTVLSTPASPIGTLRLRLGPIQRRPALRTTKHQVSASLHTCRTGSGSDRPSEPNLLRQGIPYSHLRVGVPLEIFPDERRVALTPQNAALLLKKGFAQVLVEKSAGHEAQFLDEHYRVAGATVVDKKEIFERSDILLKVRPPVFGQEAELVKEGSTLISFLYPNQNKPVLETLAARKATAFAMEMIPRISRAQVFDALRFVASCVGSDRELIQHTPNNVVQWQILLATKLF